MHRYLLPHLCLLFFGFEVYARNLQNQFENVEYKLLYHKYFKVNIYIACFGAYLIFILKLTDPATMYFYNKYLPQCLKTKNCLTKLMSVKLKSIY